MGIFKPNIPRKYVQPGESFYRQTRLVHSPVTSKVIKHSNQSKIYQQTKLKPNSVMETRKHQATEAYKRHWYDVFKQNESTRDKLRRFPKQLDTTRYSSKPRSPLKWGELLYTDDFRPLNDNRLLPEDIYRGKYNSGLTLQELEQGLQSLPVDKKAKSERKKKIFIEQYLWKNYSNRHPSENHLDFLNWKLKQQYRRRQWADLSKKYGQSFLKYNVPFNPIIPPSYESDMISIPKTNNPNEFEQQWHPQLWKHKYNSNTYMNYLNIN